MWFLIKGTFWFSMVLVLLPFLDAASTDTLERGPKVDVGDTMSAATEAFGYISALCIQKPDVCEKGAETFVALGHRAREGARIAYQFLDQQFASPDDKVMTGTIGSTQADSTTPAVAASDPNDTLAVDAEGDTVPVFKRTPVPEPRIEPRATHAG